MTTDNTKLFALKLQQKQKEKKLESKKLKEEKITRENALNQLVAKIYKDLQKRNGVPPTEQEIIDEIRKSSETSSSSG